MVWKALYMAMRYVPEDKQDEIRRKICEDCHCHTKIESLECCYCQEGSMFEKDESIGKKTYKLQNGNTITPLPVKEVKRGKRVEIYPVDEWSSL